MIVFRCINQDYSLDRYLNFEQLEDSKFVVVILSRMTGQVGVQLGKL